MCCHVTRNRRSTDHRISAFSGGCPLPGERHDSQEHSGADPESLSGDGLRKQDPGWYHSLCLMCSPIYEAGAHRGQCDIGRNDSSRQNKRYLKVLKFICWNKESSGLGAQPYIQHVPHTHLLFSALWVAATIRPGLRTSCFVKDPGTPTLIL